MTRDMIVQDHTNPHDDKILAGMFTDRSVLGRIASVWNGKLFDASTSNQLAAWAVEHFRLHHEPPGLVCIQDYASKWAEDNPDPNMVGLVDTRLQGIIRRCEQLTHELNPDYLIKMAQGHFEKIDANRVVAQAQQALKAGHLERAQEILSGYRRLPLDVSQGIDPFADDELPYKAFEKKTQTLFDYDGDLGLFFNGMLERERLIAFLAPEKTGKTWWLMDLAYRAMLKRKRVGFIECGDMSERQMLQRLYCRSASHPIRSTDGKWPYEVSYPIRLTADAQGATVEHEQRTFDGPLTGAIAAASCELVRNRLVKSLRSYMKFSAHPNSTVNVLGIKSVLTTWKMKGYEPDVLVIDYADILAPPAGKMEVRDQINTTWKQLKGLSGELKCLVVTATQADADSYDRKVMDRRNFSEDKRKLSHVDGLVGINVTSEEKEKGLFRLNWIVKRDGDYSTRRCVHVASCLPLANPAILSCW